MEASTKHTVEELQAFSNTRIPAPPWVRTVRVMIPLSSCDKAADKLIDALGGKEMANKTAGGTRWWQVRGLEGIPAEWIAVRKDIAAQRRRHEAEKARTSHLHRAKSTGLFGATEPDAKQEPHEYSAEMEGTPCMLYIHGGGGYFGSIDQQRYTLHRYARKMNGRVFAINYRLAPQYPFPCAIQDALAAYYYLLEPPEGAEHGPVDPSLIILAGDSAGGNITLALLQIIRDTGLPAPAGAVLISPWCDLTHSFPSCMTNAASDIIPPYGLSLHKPSPLWPPPSSIEQTVNRDRLVTRLKQAVHRGLHPDESDGETVTIAEGGREARRMAAALPHETTLLGDKISRRQVMVSQSSADDPDTPLEPGPSSFHGLSTSVAPGENATLLVDGKAVTIQSQIQFYAMNHQLTHPLVSPALAYLGGLPPCLFLASDKELLRDEIIYTAHKAANPERYPVQEDTREVYPAMIGIESRYGPTDVHLQVYDETCHVLPLYSFTTPAKYCYRAIATFCKFITTAKKAASPEVQHEEPERGPETTTEPPPPTSASKQEASSKLMDRRKSLMTGKIMPRASILRRLTLPTSLRRQSLAQPDSIVASPSAENMPFTPIATESPPTATNSVSISAFHHHHLGEVGTAGHPAVYACDAGGDPFTNHMIRERVATNGVIRPLEPESQIPACQMKLAEIGVLHEESVRRYLRGQAIWERKFAKVARSIEKQRQKHLNLSRKDGRRTLDKIRQQLHLVGDKEPSVPTTEPDKTADENHVVDLDSVMEKTVLGSRQWKWGWALEGESPPPSSIVARGDTGEARRLGQFADRQLGPGDEEHSISGNNLWSVVVEALTRGKPAHHDKRKKSGASQDAIQSPEADVAKQNDGYFSWFRSGRRGSSPSAPTSSLGSSSPSSSSS